MMLRIRCHHGPTRAKTVMPNWSRIESKILMLTAKADITVLPNLSGFHVASSEAKGR